MNDFAQQHWLDLLSQHNLDASLIDESDDRLTTLAIIIERHSQQVAHVNHDGRLSDEGRKAGLGELAQTTVESIDRSLGGYLQELDTRLAEIEHQLRPQEPDTDPTLEFFKQREIREQLILMDELELVALYQSLAESGDDDLCMRAIEQCPSSFPLITDKELLAAGKRARGLRGNPKSAERLRQLRKTRGVISAARDTAIVSLGVDTVSTQLEDIAAGA